MTLPIDHRVVAVKELILYKAGLTYSNVSRSALAFAHA